MNISVELRSINKVEAMPVKATANIVIDGGFVIRNVKLIENEKGRFLAMPSSRMNDGTWRNNFCHPITSECRREMEEAVIEAYENA